MIRRYPLVLVLGVLGAATGCGGSKTPTQPTPASSTITITSAGVSPKTIQISIGGRILFMNNDTRSHFMASDPHPDHGDCPEINQVEFLSPGQARETGNFVQARTCGYHDHNDPDNATLKGSITIR